MLSGLIVYGLNFFTGRNKNNKIANAWFNTHKSLLEENFSLVGMIYYIFDYYIFIKKMAFYSINIEGIYYFL